jgi:adenylate cyclase
LLAEEPDIGLLLLDINMPVMDGLTLLAELRERQSDVRATTLSPASPVGEVAGPSH